VNNFLAVPPKTVLERELNNPASAARAALSATFVPKWKANTAYLAGDKVLSPAGDVVSAKVNFTSGASYSAANWNLSTTFATVEALNNASSPAPASASLLPPKPKRQLIQTFQAGHGWTFQTPSGGTITADTTDYSIGSQSIKMMTPGLTGSTPGVSVYKFGAPAVDMTNKQFALLVKVTNSEALRSINLQFGTGSLAQSSTANFMSNQPEWDMHLGPDGRWSWITIPWNPALAGTAPNRAAITDFNLTVTDKGTGVPVEFRLGAIAAVPIPSVWTNGCLTFNFDDGFLSHYTIARPILAAYDFPADAYPVLEQLDKVNGMTTAMLKELQDTNRWLIGAHSDTWANHNRSLASQTADEREQFVRSNRQGLADRGLRGFDFFAYPGGISTGPNYEIAQQFYASARTVNQRQRETLPASDPHKLRIKLVDATVTSAAIAAEIDTAYANNFHLILVFHDIVASGATGGATNKATLQAIVDYAATKGIPVKTTAEVFATR
jgi:peptidoglycan/xylan/chitin deacetylase (PgdA/CDA1 family)